jgi:hypothetical protein
MIIQVLTAASGLDIFLRDQATGQLADPTDIDYQIRIPDGTPVESGAGFRRSVGHYDARNSIIPSGYDITEPWSIKWTFTSAAGVTSTATEEFTVVSELSPSFSNIQGLVDFVKLDLGLSDTDFTQAELEGFIEKALNRLNRKLKWTGTSNELSINSSTGLIEPTPNSSTTDLIIMQTECIMVKQLSRIAVGRGIRIRDGDTEIDTSVKFAGFGRIVDDYCNELNDAITNFLVGESSSGGALVDYSTMRIKETMSHSGQGSGRERLRESPFEVDIDTGGRGGIARSP